MDKLTHPRREQELAALAKRQHGVVARRQLLGLGLGPGAIDSRLGTGRLQLVHRGVYAVGHAGLNRRGIWLAAVLAHGEGALLSHLSAAALWRLIDAPMRPVDVTSSHGRRGRPGIRLHRSDTHHRERTARHRIPVTSVAQTLLDLAEQAPNERLRRAYEEADRLGLLRPGALQLACDRNQGHRGLVAIRGLMAERRGGATRSALEDLFVDLCRRRRLPTPAVNAPLLGFEVDALWSEQRLVVELDGFAYHRHRAAFERDRARDAALQAAGYRVVRFTRRRLEREPGVVAEELHALLAGGAASGTPSQRPGRVR
jgi:very-short-patch-repair endonuclease